MKEEPAGVARNSLVQVRSDLGRAGHQLVPSPCRSHGESRAAIEGYKFQADGDYNAWPGPNSNTFIQAILDTVPELNAVLPPTAIGKDYPYAGRWIGLTPSGTGVFVSIGGYLGLTAGWIEGMELNVLGAVLGFDLRRPALKFPGVGRVGLPVA